jgi:hypothetical protein
MVRRQHMKDRGESSVSASALERYCKSFDAAERGDVGPALAHERRPLIHRWRRPLSQPRDLSPLRTKRQIRSGSSFHPHPEGPAALLLRPEFISSACFGPRGCIAAVMSVVSAGW